VLVFLLRRQMNTISEIGTALCGYIGALREAV